MLKIEDEINNANFRLGKELSEMLADGNKNLEKGRILTFGKAQRNINER